MTFKIPQVNVKIHYNSIFSQSSSITCLRGLKNKKKWKKINKILNVIILRSEAETKKSIASISISERHIATKKKNGRHMNKKDRQT